MKLIIGLLGIAVLVWLIRNYLGLNKKTSVRTSIANLATILEQEVMFYQRLSIHQKQQFEEKVNQFLSEVTIEGVGLNITDEDRVLVAASAVIPVFYFDSWTYKNLSNVLLYPDTFNESFQYDSDKRNIAGMVGTGFMNGQMILSQRALRQGFRNNADKSNTGIHEFVHLLDKSDGETDGIPENLLAHQYTIPWLKLIHEGIRDIKKGQSDIDPYGATNDAEFFAVAAEYFFEQPQRFQQNHPELYALMQLIFQTEDK
ncbi:zinc-dependent peptidase [Solitalea sp. MAHUQ-68]|uniref:Zinc-dependent peptidase n=1 Tax=Solitalea agri TaxID=2953739 RepID=A0A9X2F9A4_9SPHI|nr:M90 family metallopeptidase [Solitalea agri]MCO4294691.1 zinc-dependent peptidase [Solitalea agri]